MENRVSLLLPPKLMTQYIKGEITVVILVRDRCPRGKGLHFLNFFNDPRIIWEQRIAALWVDENSRVVISSPLPSPPLPPLPASLSIPPPVDHKEDIPEVELPPRKRLCMTALTSGYKVGESLTAARPTRGHRANYGFIGTLDTETRCQSAEEVGYGIRDVWVDSTKAVEEVAPMILEGVNDRVTDLAQRVSLGDCVVDGAGGFSVSRGLGTVSGIEFDNSPGAAGI
ncbi:hypothetical protein Tco_0104709 [Tanacetum coccineum]